MTVLTHVNTFTLAHTHTYVCRRRGCKKKYALRKILKVNSHNNNSRNKQHEKEASTAVSSHSCIVAPHRSFQTHTHKHTAVYGGVLVPACCAAWVYAVFDSSLTDYQQPSFSCHSLSTHIRHTHILAYIHVHGGVWVCIFMHVCVRCRALLRCLHKLVLVFSFEARRRAHLSAHNQKWNKKWLPYLCAKLILARCRLPVNQLICLFA